MHALLCGGSKSGKSSYAQKLAIECTDIKYRRYYVATMLAVDQEDTKRIEAHLLDREGMGFETIELPNNLSGLKENLIDTDVLLIDSITALLCNEMFCSGAVEQFAYRTIIKELKELLCYFKNVIIVTDYILAELPVYDEITENYRRQLGHINRAIAAECDFVAEFTAGVYKTHKG